MELPYAQHKSFHNFMGLRGEVSWLLLLDLSWLSALPSQLWVGSDQLQLVYNETEAQIRWKVTLADIGTASMIKRGPGPNTVKNNTKTVQTKRTKSFSL